MRLLLGTFLLVFGLFNVGFNVGVSSKWIVLTIAVYLVPLLGQLLPVRMIHTAALWFGFFLVVQSFLSPLIPVSDFRTLPVLMERQIDVISGAVPGIEGIQRITTDRLGFRVTPPVDYTADDTYRIFAIGASTTEQIFIDDERTWTHLLQVKLRSELNQRIEVINTGLAGLRAVHNLATFREVLAYHPDMVLFLIGVNDWNKQIREHFGSGAYRNDMFANYPFKATLLGKVITDLQPAVTGLARRVLGEANGVETEDGSYFSRQRNSLGREDQHEFRPSDVALDYQETLRKIGALCRQSSITCVFLTQPSGYAPSAAPTFAASFWMTPPNETYTLDLGSMAHIAALYNDYLGCGLN